MQLVFRFCHVVEQKFQYQRTAQAPALDLEVGKSHRHIDIPNVPDADKPRIFHRLREAVAFLRTRCGTDMFGAGFAEIFSADILIAALSVPASDPAALVAEKFHFVLQRLGQGVQLGKGLVQPEIRHHIAEILPLHLPAEVPKVRQNLGGGGDEIERGIGALQVVQGQEVGVDEILHVDVVPDAGAVPGGIVVAVNRHMVPPSVGNLQNNGDQVGLRVMRLADLAGHMRAAGVEVPQRDKMDAVCNGSPVEHPLHRQLRVAVAICGMRRVGLENRHTFRFAVGRGGRGKDDVFDAVLDHRLQHCPRAAEVVVVVLERIYHALADLGVCREMDDCVDLFAGKDVVAEFLIADVALIEPRLRMDGFAEAGFQIVRHDHIVAVVNKFVNGVAADVTSAA